MEQQNPQPASPARPDNTAGTGRPAPSAGKMPIMAMIAYILFFVPLLTGDAKKNPFVKFHTKQGLVLFIAVVLINVIKGLMPYRILWTFGWIFWLLSLGTLVLLIIGIANARNHKREPLPLIGKFADYFKF